VSGDTKVNHAAGVQLDDDEHEEGAEEDVIGLKEVAGPDWAGVVAQERRPVLLGGERFADLCDVLLDGALAHAQSELEKFTLDAFCPPGVVFLGQSFDQGDDFVS
jgi:hypothetical protein